MQLFYTADVQNDLAILGQEESQHCLRVLRKQAGDFITIVDGKGRFYQSQITSADKKNCVCRILSVEEILPSPPVHLHLAIAPTKNRSRFEWFLEKATEIGVRQITPLLCRRSERKAIRTDRMEKILITAMKQAQRARLPQLAPMMKLEDFTSREQLKPNRKFIACIDENVKTHLQENYEAGQDVCILIGPEGGFAPEEVALAKSQGFEAVSLGDRRLRTETAGLVACHTINLMNYENRII